MPSFCPNCAAALDPDAKFCPACSSPVAYAGGGGGYPGGGGYGQPVGPGPQRPPFQMPGMKIDTLAIAGVISIFWAVWFLAACLAPETVIPYRIGVGGANNPGWSSAEAQATWLMLLYSFFVVEVAFQIPIAYGILTRKRWAQSLLMMFGIPLAVIYAALTLIVFFLSDPKFTGVTLFTIFGVIIGLALVGLQIMFVSRNRHQFTD